MMYLQFHEKELIGGNNFSHQMIRCEDVLELYKEMNPKDGHLKCALEGESKVLLKDDNMFSIK